MASNNFFDLTNGVDIFTIDTKVPAGFGIRALAGADFIVGSDRPDLVYGNDGADSIAGGLGNDSLQGGRGADLLLGDAGDDYLLGERGNDVLYGGQDNDTLMGQEGDDFLAGGAGVDSLIGGQGSDAFVLNVADAVTNPALADTIADFSNEQGDVIALTDGAGDALTEADVTLEANGTDTFIRLKATGGILARVQGVSPASLTGLFSTAKATLDNTEPGATVLASIPGGATLQGAVGDDDYADFFQFQVTTTSIVNFGLSGLSADADLALYKDLNNDGELGGDEIISASERSGTANESIENVTLDPGKYFLSVEAYEGNTNYTLSVSGVAGTVARDLAGDRPSTARALPPDGEVELHDYVGGADAVDTYRLDVLNAGYLDLFADNRKADLNVTLWSDRNGNNQLDADEIVAQGTNEIQQDNIDPGTYYVNVTAPGAATPYKISAESDLGSRVDIESYDPLFPGIPTTGTLTQNDNFDPNDEENYADPYVLSEQGAGLTVTVTQESQDFDAYLRVVDLLTGEVVAENNDINRQGGDFNARVSFTTQPGVQYVVYASSVDAPGLGDYTLNTTVTGTPVPNAVRSASADTLLPPPSFTYKGTTNNFTYAPLTGGLAKPIKISGLNQNGFGNCAFMAALGATFGTIDKNLTDANVKESEILKVTENDGNYTLTFYSSSTGAAKDVTVDNQVVTKTNGYLFGAKWPSQFAVKPEQAKDKPIWGSIFERAYAKFRGEETGKNGYDVTGNGDWPGDALKRLTGKVVTTTYLQPSQVKQGNNSSTQSLTDKSKDVFNSIKTALDQKRYVATWTIGGGNDTKALYNGVLYQSHAYSIHNAYEEDGQKLILLRNPHGVDNSNNVQAEEDPSNDLKDGFITITFDAFVKNFSGVAISQA
ncbi:MULTISPECIES: C2 family cysteine protease [unclassified Microcoleus]|uniref:C2 family cysteine protease n=1 Tax=unclassified Microcoleus TaxID=2642155 RepID=UPI002FCF99EC